MITIHFNDGKSQKFTCPYEAAMAFLMAGRKGWVDPASREDKRAYGRAWREIMELARWDENVRDLIPGF